MPKIDETTASNARLQEFLTDPKHQEQRDFMSALIDARLNERVVQAKQKTADVGGNFFDNLVAGLTGDLFAGEK